MVGLGEAASIITIIQITEKILSLHEKYYSGIKKARRDMERLRDEVTSFHNVLMKVQELADGPKAIRLPASNSLAGGIQQGASELEDLRNRLDLGQGRRAMRRLGLRALKWPFTSKEVDKHVEMLGRHKATFTLALTTDQA